VLENMILERIFGPKRDEGTRGCRKVPAEEVNKLRFTPGIIMMMKLMTMWWAGHIEQMGAMRNAQKILIGSLNRRDNSKDLGINKRTLLKWISVLVEWTWISAVWLGIVAGCCEHGDELSGSVKKRVISHA
jgi:hypothetical protein